MELAGHFKNVLATIEPTREHVARAKAAHNSLRSDIRSSSEIGKAHVETYLSGSYARHTAINDINDVDVICILDIDRTITEPSVLLAWLSEALREFYASARVQGRSVRVIAENSVHLDVVPGCLSASSDSPLWIPDREAAEWVISHPKGQLDASLAKNETTGGYYVQVVKLLKWWRDRSIPKQEQPRSYILETLVFDGIGSWAPKSHADAVVRVLDDIRSRYEAWKGTGETPFIADPGYPANSVSKRWESADFDTFVGHSRSALDAASRALEETDEAESRRLWRSLFGNAFAASG